MSHANPHISCVYLCGIEYTVEVGQRCVGNSGKRSKGYSAVGRRGVSGNGVIVVREVSSR